MCHECDDEYEDDVEFSSSSVDRLQELPTEVRNQLISELQDHMSYIMDKAEQNGFLFELITEWPRQKVAMYEAAVVMQRQILNDVADDHNH
jgi:hypothetical protein